MRRFLAALAFAAAVALPASAADIKNIDLGKNAEVWFAEDHTVPIIAFNIALPAGSAYDPAAKPGLASFTASLIDEGAGGMDSRAFHEALADRAIRFSAGAERDYLVISIVTLSENAPEALHLLQLALTRPRFDAEAVTRVRQQILQSIQQSEAEPPRVAGRAFMRAFFNGHAYGHPIVGEADSIAHITPEDLRGFARSHWVKAGIKIAVTGDITQAQAQKLLAAAFSPVSGARPPALPEIGRLGAPGVHVFPMPVPQPTVMFGLPGIMRADPDFIPGYVANYIVGGGGFASRLTAEVREKRGLTYGIETSLNSYRKASVMLGQVATRADAVRQTVQVVKDTLKEFADDGPTQQELDDAKTYLTGSFPLAFASNGGTAAQLGTFQRQNLDIGYVTRRNALIQAVTLDEVKRVGKRLFDPARLTVVIAGTPEEGGVRERPKPPVRPPLPTTATAPAAETPPPAGARPAAKPADKPVSGVVTAPNSAKKP